MHSPSLTLEAIISKYSDQPEVLKDLASAIEASACLTAPAQQSLVKTLSTREAGGQDIHQLSNILKSITSLKSII